MDLTRYKAEFIERPTPGELAQMIHDGASLHDLAADFGCATSTLRNDLYAAGYSPATGDAKATRHDRQQREDTLPAPPLAIPGPWVDDALCAEVDQDIFFPEKGGSTREAKAVCAACPVVTECLDYALANNEHYGIWGGASERDRRTLTGRTSTRTCGECGQEFAVPTGANSVVYCGPECRRAARAHIQDHRRPA